MEKEFLLHDLSRLRFDDLEGEDKFEALLITICYRDGIGSPTNVSFNAFSHVFTVDKQSWLVLTTSQAIERTRTLMLDDWSTYPAHVLAKFCHEGYTTTALDAIRQAMPMKFSSFFVKHCLSVHFSEFIRTFSEHPSPSVSRALCEEDNKNVVAVEHDVFSIRGLFLASYDHKEIVIHTGDDIPRTFLAYRVV